MIRKLYLLAGCFCLVGLSLAALSGANAAEDGLALYKRACIGCHGADGSSTAMGIPQALKGQSADDLYKKLAGYKNGTFGFEKKKVMENALKPYSDEQLKALADGIATL